MINLSAPISSTLQPFAAVRGQICTLVLAGGVMLNFLFANGHDEQRCFELVVLLLAALVFILRRGWLGTPLISGRPVLLALLAFFTIGLVSAFAALSLRHALFEWSSLLLLTVLAFCVATEIAAGGKDALQFLLRLIGIVCLLYSLRFLLFYAATLASAYSATMHDLAIGFSNARFLNHTQTALLPLLVLLCLQAPARSALSILWFCLTAFWWALLYMSEARSSLLALAAASVVLLLVRRKHAHSFLKVLVWSALAGCLVYAMAFVLLPQLVGLPPFGSATNALIRTAADPASGRLMLWTRAIELVMQAPWIGVGPLHFAHYGVDVYLGAHPHNWVLQVAAEWGVPALLCMVFIIAAGMRALWRAGKQIATADVRNQQILSALLVASVAILVDGLFSGVFVMPQSRLAIALVLGCAIAWVRSCEGQAERVHTSRRAHAFAVAIVFAAACALVYSVAPDAVSRARSEPLSATEQALNPTDHWPRLWEAGYF